MSDQARHVMDAILQVLPDADGAGDRRATPDGGGAHDRRGTGEALVTRATPWCDAQEQTETCDTCCGSGSIERPHPSGWDEWGTIYGECPTCKGRGWVRVANSHDSPKAAL